MQDVHTANASRDMIAGSKRRKHKADEANEAVGDGSANDN